MNDFSKLIVFKISNVSGIALHFFIVILFFSCNSANTSNDKRPNFIILFADDLGYGDLQCYGHPTIRTPNLDNMAKEGLKLTCFYVALSMCSPSRAALLTGKYLSNAGVTKVFNYKSEAGLPLEEITIAEGLKSVGYSTAIIGKWHLGRQPEYLPMNQGFDYWFGVPYSNDNDSISAPGNDYLEGPTLPLYENNSILERGVSMKTITKRYTTKAIEFIKQEKNNPFFLYLPYTLPHVPLDASKEFKNKSKAGLYGDVVEELDWSVGQILSTLDDFGLKSKTMIIFTSDNGPMVHIDRPNYNEKIIKNWHHGTAGVFRGDKFDVYEGGFRVPAIIQWDEKIAANRISSEIVISVDFLPTIFNLAGLYNVEKESIDGKDLTKFFLHDNKSPNKEMIYEKHGKRMAYRNGEWKIVYNNLKPGYELYNIKNDLSKKHDLAEMYPDKVHELCRYLTY
jgi:arylsulfatase A